MSDTRTTQPTTPTKKPTSAGSSEADRAKGEAEATTPERAVDATTPERAADAMTPERAADARPTERLTTADIARGGSDEREGAAPAREPGAHRSNMPEPKVAPLFSDDATSELRERWTDVQASFVDEPKSAVEQADALVAEVMKRLADSFATERQALEQQWSRGDDASTEDLRVALRRYRSFFDRLLSI
jgi:hypothetical protein